MAHLPAVCEGTTVLPGQEPLRWRIREVRLDRSFIIEMPLDRAVLTFEWSFEGLSPGRTRITQRTILSGDNGTAYAPQVRDSFGKFGQSAMRCRMRESRSIPINEDEIKTTCHKCLCAFSDNRGQPRSNQAFALDRTLEKVLPIRFAEVVEWAVLLGNVSRIKKCHKNVMPRLHFRVAGYFLAAAERAF